MKKIFSAKNSHMGISNIEWVEPFPSTCFIAIIRKLEKMPCEKFSTPKNSYRL
jgi:hypothetical protein